MPRLILFFAILLALPMHAAPAKGEAGIEIPAHPPLGLKVVDCSSVEDSSGSLRVTVKIEIKNVSKEAFKVSGYKDPDIDAIVFLHGPDSGAYLNHGGDGKPAKWEFAGAKAGSFAAHDRARTLQPGEACQGLVQFDVSKENRGVSCRCELYLDDASGKRFCERTEVFELK